MRKKGSKRSARIRRGGHVISNGRGATTRLPRHANGGDHGPNANPDIGQDARWDRFLADAIAMFGECDHPGALERLRERFDAGLVGPEMLGALRFLASEDFPGDILEPLDFGELVERAEEIDELLVSSLGQVGRWLIDDDADIRHDPARALVEFAEALDWARNRPDRVAALLREIQAEPGFSCLAAWPRLAHLLAHFGPDALEGYPLEAASLVKRARVELSGRPTIVPPAVYRLLGIGADDDRSDGWHHRMALEAVAQHLGDLLFAPGRRFPAESSAKVPGPAAGEQAIAVADGGTAAE